MPDLQSVEETRTVVPTSGGDLPAVITHPAGSRSAPLPGVVFVDGSGPGDVDDWGGWPGWIAGCGAVVLRHGKPGTGAAGDWRGQTIGDRARESATAVEVLRSSPGVDSERVGLMGFSQGGWVAPMVAADGSGEIAFIVNVSGPAVSVEETERYRLRRAAVDAGHDVAAVLDFYETVIAALLKGDRERAMEVAGTVATEPWYPILEGLYETPELIGFLSGILAYDPRPYLDVIGCPLLACFGGDDSLVPVAESMAALAPVVQRDEACGVFVFPNADHGIFIDDPDPDVDRQSQLAPGFLAVIEGFLRGS